MITIATDTLNNDIFLDSKGFLAIKEDKAAVNNIALNNVRTLQGEDDLNLQNGIPYFDVLFNDRPQLALFKQFVIEQIRKIDGVADVQDFEINIKDNVLKYALTIKMQDGTEVQVNG